MEIYLGPAGSPARSTLEGLEEVKRLGLRAMEVQFTHGMNMGVPLAKQIGEENRKQKVRLSVHAPYYINLSSDEKVKQKASIKRILDSCERGHHMGAKEIVFHPAYFGKNDKEDVYQTTKEHIQEMMRVIRKKKWNVLLAPETTGKHSALGSLEETIRLSKETGCSLCVDFAHIYARNQGKIDYIEILSKLKPLKPKHLHCHFSGINYTEKGEQSHRVLDHCPDFRPLAKALLKQKWLPSVSIISESPITWKDSLKMKEILEKGGHRFG